MRTLALITIWFFRLLIGTIACAAIAWIGYYSGYSMDELILAGITLSFALLIGAQLFLWAKWTIEDTNERKNPTKT